MNEHIHLDAADSFAEPAFVADGGKLPDRYKTDRPLTTTENYALNTPGRKTARRCWPTSTMSQTISSRTSGWPDAFTGDPNLAN